LRQRFLTTNRTRETKLEFWAYQRVRALGNIPFFKEPILRSEIEFLITSLKD
jgi:hypothetical protein